ncbi:guanylate cyclase [Spirochaetia bacterium]|nr:guanylate cyclase [Spirochaetia bacterium]
MTIRKLSILTALGTVLLFSVLYITPFFQTAENKIYDIFLRFRPRREHLDNIVFLDVDDQAIAHVGVFPWPRSVMAEGLLRLKEYGVDAAIFDIEYIDKSPTEVDELYLQQGLKANYNRRFSEIGVNMADLLGAISGGYIRGEEAADYIQDITALIENERDSLYRETMKITLDNDIRLAQASALFGKTWGTLNLQETDLLEGEQAQRRALAEQRFSYPVTAAPGVSGGDNKDILPAIPVFMESVKGAGFTNVTIDSDGIRRRIFPARKVMEHWYLQLAFAPLVEYLGKPEIEIQKDRLVMKGAGADSSDIVIPLDRNGAMLLDWPREDYQHSFTHISFVRFSLLEEYQNHIEQYLNALALADYNVFPAIVENAEDISAVFENAAAAKNAALTENSDTEFERYIALRDQGLESVRTFIALGTAYLQENTNSSASDYVLEEAGYCSSLFDYLETELKATDETREVLNNTLPGKICIIGRVDTGTTDIGVNPFHGEYVNVGTHAVVLDTVLSQSFITLLPSFWSVILTCLLIPAVLIGISGLKPALRIPLGIGGVILSAGISFTLFYIKGYFLGPIGPVLAMISAVIIREAIAFTGTEREKIFIRSAFSRYLAPAVIDQIIADPSQLNLGGRNLEMTAIFTDVRSFSTISEALKDPETNESDPRKLVDLLNFYLTRMSNIILENQGTIDKYEGDAIIAFFGAPIPTEDHAIFACRSALQMKKAEIDINREALEQGLINDDVVQALIDKGIIKNSDEPPIFTRLGINTGKMVVGNMGTPNKMDYTIMGNAVNLAARLEGVNKQYNTRGILISGYTRQKLGNIFTLRRLDRVRVVGINTWVRLYEVLELADQATPEMLANIKLFDQGVDIFEKEKDWTAAKAFFQKVLDRTPNDGPTRIYYNRCEQYQKKPPAPTWDGIYNLDQK